MPKLSIFLVAALALFASCAAEASVPEMKVSAKIDFDEKGFPYQPILCGHVSQCRCRGFRGGQAQCSRCPNDKGSKYKNSKVCWCKDVWNRATQHECSPLKADGPQQPGDWDSSGTEYRALRCHKQEQCGCAANGQAQCSRCPEDMGSKNRYNNVCWCKGIHSNSYGHRWGNECNERKPNGPFQKVV